MLGGGSLGWRKPAISRLEEHPNALEIVGILAQLPHIPDTDLPRLAQNWTNTVYVAEARAHALEPDSPLVVEVLAAFEALVALFDEDLAGDAEYVTVEPQVTTLALKAVRDAIAAAYAKPVLSRGEYNALIRPWREVYPALALEEPDLGPSGDSVKALLLALPRLAHRCHDHAGREIYDRLARLAAVGDEDLREVARAEAWRVAVLTSRRRIWTMVRRSAAEGLGRWCPDCRDLRDHDDEEMVFSLCADAACAMLVADALDDTLVDVLTLPLADVIPAQRTTQ